MLHIAAFLKALGKYWWALMSSALFTILSVYAAATNRSNTWFFWASIVVIFCSLLSASFLAWREEYVANLAGPQILIDWTSHEHGHDTISFRNVGSETAFNVVADGFSWENLAWHRRIEIPSIDTGQFSTSEAQFRRELSDNSSEVGYLRHILQAPGREGELAVFITFESLRKTKYRRRFVLSLVQRGPNLEIRCNPGKLVVTRV